MGALTQKTMAGMIWEEWGPEAFARARREKKSVLLFFHVRGSILNRRTAAVLGAKAAAAEVAAHYVAVRGDADKRPDLFARFSSPDGSGLGVLSHDGRLLARISDSTRLSDDLKENSKQDPSELKSATPAPVWTGAVGQAKPDPALAPGWPAAVVDKVIGAKPGGFPCFDCLELLLYVACEWKEERARDVLAARLKEFSSGAFFDRPSGSFSLPDWEKTLAVNARACRLFWDARAATESEAFGETAIALSEFLLRDLYDPSPGAFRPTAGESAEKIYFTDANALAASALLKSSAMTGDKRFADAASAALLFLQQMCDPERGLSHYWEAGLSSSVYGLLADASWTMIVFTESFLASGLKAHREFADALLRGLFQENWERERGGFCDRSPQPGDFGAVLAALIPPDLNAASFEAAWRLHQVKGNPQYKSWIEWGLKRLAADVGGDGCRAAPLARMADILRRGRLDLELVGRENDPKTRALLDAVNRRYLPRKILSFVDPDDQDYIMAHKLKPGSLPRLYGCLDLKPKTEAGAPEEVLLFLKELADG